MTDLSVNRYKQNGTVEKLLGAVYTPPRVASALVRWAVRSAADKVLDPACGDGVFLAAAQTRLADLGNRHPTCVGVDIDPQAARATGAICSDFFEWAPAAPTFDVIIGNPPFIRSHLFSEESRKAAFGQMKAMGLHPSRLMSTWAPFVAVASKLLSDEGRLAFVVPEELLHVNYAEELRHFLLARFRRVIVCLPEENLFPSVQQAVLLLLCDHDTSGPAGLLTLEYAALEEGPPYAVTPASAWDWTSKWTHLFLSSSERLCIHECFNQFDWKPLKDYGRVQVGVVTGYNSFFIVSKAKAEFLADGEFFTPIVTKAQDLRGIELASRDFESLVKQGRPAFLLHTSEPVEQLPAELRDYLAYGEGRGIHLRYKCRMRTPWYAVPSVYPADALMLRQAGDFPRLVHLAKRMTSTDTIHRVHWSEPALGRRHAVGFLNTWTLLFCELTGRSYGGGVLELMPGEANNILMPPPLRDLEIVFDRVDQLVRQKQFGDAVGLVDRIVTPPAITDAQHESARNILSKLIARRKNKSNGNHRR